MLGSWISSRRLERKRGALARKRIAELDALGMVWEPRDKHWHVGLAAARAYREAHGDLRVPQSLSTDDGFRLGTWIAIRRTERGRGRLLPERIDALDALDMVWDTRKTT